MEPTTSTAAHRKELLNKQLRHALRGPHLKRFSCAVVVATALVSAILPGSPVAAREEAAALIAPPGPGPASPSSHFLRLGHRRTVDVRSLRPDRRGTHPALEHPFLPRDPATYARQKRRAHEAQYARRGNVFVLPIHDNSGQHLAPADQSGGSPVAFSGMNLLKQVSLFGGDQAVTPPDTQLGAGPTYLVEMTNSTGAVWTKTGSLVKAFDLTTFYQVPAGFAFSDPRILYDRSSGRWFASGLAFDAAGDSMVFVGVSTTSDPTAPWTTHAFGPFSGVLADQPKLGTSDDKAVLSWNDFRGTQFIGQETWVLQKSDLLGGASTVATFVFGPDATRFGVVPVQSLSATTTEYLAYNNADAQDRNTSFPSLGVVALTGTPTSGNVTWTESDPTIAQTSIPPLAQQAGGTPVDTGDDRLLSAVWQNNVLWVAGNDGCVPASDAFPRSCLKLVRVSTAGTPPTVVQDFDVSAAQSYLDYPALALDGTGNMFLVCSVVSSTSYESTITTGELAGSTSPTPPTVLKAGEGPYSGFDPRIGANRWGDYSGAAADPSDPTQIWVAGEYAATSAVVINWGTEIGAAAPPDVTRPALTGVRDAPDPFSPNGDGRKDKVRIYWHVSEGSVVTTTIATKNGTIVRVFKVFATQGNWVNVWNGRNRGGHLEKPGTYVYSIQAVDAAGNRSAVARGTIGLVR